MKSIEKIIAILSAAGIQVETRQGVFGRYYDGIDREITVDIIRFTYDFYSNGWGAYNAYYKAIETIRKRFKGYVVTITQAAPSGIGSGYIATATDAEKIENAERKAAAFQNAFWSALHEGKTQAEAVAIGKKAAA